MADNDNLLSEAARARAEADKRAAAKSKGKAKRPKRRPGLPMPTPESRAENARRAEAKRRQAQVEAAKKQERDQAAIAYNNALRAAKAAAARYDRSQDSADLIAFDRAKAELTRTGKAYKQLTGKSPETVSVTRPKAQPRGLPGNRTVVRDTDGTARATGATGPAGSEIPRARRVTPPVPTTPSTAPVGAGGGKYDPNMVTALVAAGYTREEAIALAQQSWAATNGGAAGGGPGGAPSRTVSVSRQVQRYTADQLEMTATRVAQDALGRALSASELKALTKQVNKEARLNPTISRTVTRYRGATTTSSTTTKGGIDEAQVIQSFAEKNPEYAGYQQATTYFDAMLGALRGTAGGSI